MPKLRISFNVKGQGEGKGQGTKLQKEMEINEGYSVHKRRTMFLHVDGHEMVAGYATITRWKERAQLSLFTSRFDYLEPPFPQEEPSM